jgi:xanthine/uracil/vitamin C permease (AzgA family)
MLSALAQRAKVVASLPSVGNICQVLTVEPAGGVTIMGTTGTTDGVTKRLLTAAELPSAARAWTGDALASLDSAEIGVAAAAAVGASPAGVAGAVALGLDAALGSEDWQYLPIPTVPGGKAQVCAAAKPQKTSKLAARWR